MKKAIMIVSIISLVFSYSCEKDANETEKAKMINSKDQAEDAVWAIIASFRRVAPIVSYQNYSNHKVSSATNDGYAIVNGIVEKKSLSISSTSSSYKNVSINFCKYQENNFDPIVDGTASVNGTIYYKSSSYEGSWTLTASSIKFSGSIEDQASVSVTFYSSINWMATISCTSGTYNIDSLFKK